VGLFIGLVVIIVGSMIVVHYLAKVFGIDLNGI